MTILSKKSSKKKVSCGTNNNNNNNSNNNGEVENNVGGGGEGSIIIPQPVGPVFPGQRSSESFISNNIPVEEETSEQYEQIESNNNNNNNNTNNNTSSHQGKRRHRATPTSCIKSKHGRVEHERSAVTSSPTPRSPRSGSPVEARNLLLPVATSTATSPCNSEDEYEAQPHSQKLNQEEWTAVERRFEKKMRKKGYIIKKMGEDGACLFRAVADQVYGDQEMHVVVRKHCMDYITANGDYYSQYVTEDLERYVDRKRLEHVHGNHIEIQAMSEMYNRAVIVFSYRTEPINIFHGTNQSDNEPIRLSYHRGVHYNSLVDPYKATVGVGLGLPGHIPGLADKNIVKEATRQSEDMLIEQTMLEDKLRATDWEATNEALEEQVARESYIQWLQDNERRNRGTRSPTASTSSAPQASSSSSVRSPRHWPQGSSNISPGASPYRGESAFRYPRSQPSPPPSIPEPSQTSFHNSPSRSVGNPVPDNSERSLQLLETSAVINQLPPELFGMDESDEAGMMAQVLAVSQQEYLDSLKQNLYASSSSATSQEDFLPQ